MVEVTRQHATRRQTGVMFMTCTNGSRHYGWVESGKKHGVWMSVHTDGTTTETLYAHDQAVGNTTQRFASGEVLVGTCVGGRIQGPAMLQTKSGVVISGHYENGNFRGIILRSFPNGRLEQFDTQDPRLFMHRTAEGKFEHFFLGKRLRTFAAREPRSPSLDEERCDIDHMERVAKRRKQSDQDDANAPPEFVCAITLSVFKDPVVATDGNTYERDAIARHFGERMARGEPPTSPRTNLPISPVLVDNLAMKRSIADWRMGRAFY